MWEEAAQICHHRSWALLAQQTVVELNEFYLKWKQLPIASQ
jgi:hypothetical protein